MVKIIGRVHTHDTPDVEDRDLMGGMKYPLGTVWECACGTLFQLYAMVGSRPKWYEYIGLVDRPS